MIDIGMIVSLHWEVFLNHLRAASDRRGTLSPVWVPSVSEAAHDDVQGM